MAGNSRDAGRSVTARALAVLGAFDAEHPRLTLSEIARRSRTPLATAHRLVGELETWGALTRESNGTYRIGLRLWEIGSLSPVSMTLRELALPFMQDLYEATRENVHLAVRRGHEAMYIEKLTGHHSAPIISRTGRRLPLHTTGVGKTLLAYAPQSVVQKYCSRSLLRSTPYTITEPGRLARELEMVRHRGYAQCREEMTLGNCSVGAPVYGQDGSVVAALGLVVHSVRANLPKLARHVTLAADGVRTRLAQAATEDQDDAFCERPA